MLGDSNEALTKKSAAAGQSKVSPDSTEVSRASSSPFPPTGPLTEPKAMQWDDHYPAKPEKETDESHADDADE